MVVFKAGDPIYHSKLLSFYRKEPFKLEASYQFPDQIPYPDPLIGRQSQLTHLYCRSGRENEEREGLIDAFCTCTYTVDTCIYINLYSSAAE